ncbi:thiamine pyrophosphate-dependent enzyme, partial [Asanoa sp. NPDC050611]|uniref:thiamine pyrophosphate-dependent enzyme n=1 Tax=Asanoa sp. NPDC050611 TaxID=3157098 RepID=UPI0033F32271
VVDRCVLGELADDDDRHRAVGDGGQVVGGPSEEAMEECDALLMVGTSFPYGAYLPEPGQARVAQIDSDPSLIGLRLPVEAPVAADAKLALAALLPLLSSRDGAFLAKYRKKSDAWRSDMAALEDAGREPIAPQYAIGVLDDLATDDAILTCDSGTIATWAARHWTIRGDRRFYLSGNLATMAPGLPYAIAMQLAYPGRQVIAYVGDGGFAMLMAEFLTAVRHELPVKVVINNNNSYGQILWEQIVLGYPEYGVRHRRPVADFASWARGCGAYGAKVGKPGDVADAVRAALAHPGPALVDVDVNPDEPPMPGKVTYEQAKRFTESFLRGQPHKVATMTTIARDKINELRS